MGLQSQGRVLDEDFHHWALPGWVGDGHDEFVEVARAYKGINAPVAGLGLASLKVSTKARGRRGRLSERGAAALFQDLVAQPSGRRDALTSILRSKLCPCGTKNLRWNNPAHYGLLEALRSLKR